MTLIIARNNVAGRSTARAVTQYWWWTITKHLVARDAVAVALPTGGNMLVPPWSQIAGCLLAVGFTEPREQHFVADICRPGDVFLDVGANIGLYGVTAGYQGATVVAFEPVERAARLAEENMRRNRVEGIVHRVALADRDGMTGFSEGDVGAHIDPSGPNEVRVRRLDAFDIEPGVITILKVDAEGHDLEVLRGAHDLLAQILPIVLVEIWAGGREVRELLDPLGYRYFDYDWRSCRLLDERGQLDGNLLAIHPDRLAVVRSRLTGSHDDLEDQLG